MSTQSGVKTSVEVKVHKFVESVKIDDIGVALKNYVEGNIEIEFFFQVMNRYIGIDKPISAPKKSILPKIIQG